jgi:hypothetical protein
MQQPTEYSKDTQCYGDIPTPIDETSIWIIIGGNVNGIKTYVDMGDLLTILEILRALQAGTIAFSETNVEWHKFILRENTQSLLQKAFGATRVEYSTSSSKFETTHTKPGGGTMRCTRTLGAQGDWFWKGRHWVWTMVLYNMCGKR